MSVTGVRRARAPRAFLPLKVLQNYVQRLIKHGVTLPPWPVFAQCSVTPAVAVCGTRGGVTAGQPELAGQPLQLLTAAHTGSVLSCSAALLPLSALPAKCTTSHPSWGYSHRLGYRVQFSVLYRDSE